MLVSPDMPGGPDVWLLGSSMWSSQAAAQFGLPYAFALFFSPEPTRHAIERYRQDFRPNHDLGPTHRLNPEASAAIGVICAETQSEADRLFQSVQLLQLRIRQNDRRPVACPEEAAAELPGFGPPAPEINEFPRYIVGTPDVVRTRLIAMAKALKVDELIVNTITHDHAARLRSYTLLSEAMSLDEDTCSLETVLPAA